MVDGANGAINELTTKIKLLNELLWENRCNQPQVESWLENFTGAIGSVDEERAAALHVVSHLSYYGLPEIRELLVSLFRDHVRQPIIQSIRDQRPELISKQDLARPIYDELSRTRFLGMGNPSESGTHLLYYFRQENGLSKKLFINSQQLFTHSVRNPNAALRYADVERYVFLDDLCGSGQQSVEYTETLLRDLREVAKQQAHPIEIVYLVLFGNSDGLQHARDNSGFDRVEAVCEFDTSFKTFAQDSRCFNPCPTGVDQARSEEILRHYGSRLLGNHPLGYRDGQLLLAFHHNVPDNTLPVIWSSGTSQTVWKPLLKRAGKLG